jgi:hypothetical protein
MMFRVFWDVAQCSLIGVSEVRTALIMEEICTSETSVHSNETTRCYIPRDTKLKTTNEFDTHI